jgi:Ca-activated chloride channel homolog
VVSIVCAGAAIAVTAIIGLRAQAPLFRARVDLVNLGVMVSDRKGHLIGGLQPSDFEILEDGRKQTIQYFSAGDGGSAPETHLAVVIDISGSMAPALGFVQSAVIKFFDDLADALDITIVDFDEQVRLSQYSRSDGAHVVQRVRSLRIGGATALYDAIGVYLDAASDQNGRKILLVYTDGDDNASSSSLTDLLGVLKASDVTVYSIGVLNQLTPTTRTFMAILERIAEASGGEALFPSTVDDLDGAYKRVLQQVKAQYTIGYVSTNPKYDGTWRNVAGRLVAKDHAEYRVRARGGYYAPYKPDGKF